MRATSARPSGARPEVPEKMTSSILPPRKDFAPCSPMTQANASTTLDLPEPLGPTTQVTPGSKWSVVADAKDLKPFRVNVLRCTVLRWSGAGKGAWNEFDSAYSAGSPKTHTHLRGADACPNPSLWRKLGMRPVVQVFPGRRTTTAAGQDLIRTSASTLCPPVHVPGWNHELVRQCPSMPG